MKAPIILLFIVPVLHAAPVLKLTDDGIVITEDGIKTVLAFPAIVGPDGADADPIDKSATDISASLAYKGGGKIEVSILGGDVTYTTTGLSDSIKALVFTAPIDTKSVEGGKYRFDRKIFDFTNGTSDPSSTAEARTFGILPVKGPGLSFTFAADSKHQLVVERGKDFVWQCSVPLKSGKDVVTLQIAGGEPASLLPAAVPQSKD